jgi:hypothetical protein
MGPSVGLTEIPRDVHDDAVMFVASPAADRDQSAGRLAHLPMVPTCRHGAWRRATAA